ncbi:DUF481 domain-containing protein [Litorisediminicola beolgyonensis]|uniref:YdiY family protein n=1 Tax=Litorisediminicola beolgyonensis TaxID=1173614 RepID=A0ABW3ZI03_9RHOB
MRNHVVTALVSSTALLVAVPAVAQTAVFTNEDRVEDRIDDLNDDIADAAEREIDAFGNEGRARGFTGNVSLSATATDGNTDTADIGIGSRLGYFDGVNGHKLSLSYDYSEENDTETSNSLLAGYDYTRELGRNTFVFGKGVAVYDEFDSYEEDYFVGVGLGYRFYNTADIQWSVQAGPGYRGTVDTNGEWNDEAAYTISSNYAHKLSDTVWVTNDTNFIGSEQSEYITNDLAVNVSMTDALALRTSLLTEHNTDPLPGFEKTDNKLGVSVVYSFN